ncbi:glutathione S-transferase family protein [Pseudenhygromyxa sp. WMMC2535]|uniref:glutathione S-transferase family protein n=1 Tax=Pseudenhygromyxa sp. WMMC2535 TaxID=2712867 RepID=UPI001551D676|nr:glutathione S-transferase family protein [Pseudenhygromyxa sp. WMMC2535]NVB41948.1 glutathione S-transferase family protein [Pseudenhygromyxa sp. WMMC2535]
MSYVIYGARGSGSAIVELACAAIGVEYELRDLDMRGKEQRSDGYTAINPRQKIPTLALDAGEYITESMAIVITLDERHREAGLLPAPGSKARAQALRWMAVMATEVYPIVEIIDYPQRFLPADAASEVVTALGGRAKEIWAQRWLTIEAAVAGEPYLLEEGFSAADLYIAVLSRWDLEPAWRSEHLPRVEALTAALRARPALAETWARHFGQR